MYVRNFSRHYLRRSFSSLFCLLSPFLIRKLPRCLVLLEVLRASGAQRNVSLVRENYEWTCPAKFIVLLAMSADSPCNNFVAILQKEKKSVLDCKLQGWSHVLSAVDLLLCSFECNFSIRQLMYSKNGAAETRKQLFGLFVLNKKYCHLK